MANDNEIIDNIANKEYEFGFVTDIEMDVAPARELRAALPHALRLARLARHESWLRATPPMSPAERADWGMAASAWLARVPDPPLLTPAAS